MLRVLELKKKFETVGVLGPFDIKILFEEIEERDAFLYFIEKSIRSKYLAVFDKDEDKSKKKVLI